MFEKWGLDFAPSTKSGDAPTLLLHDTGLFHTILTFVPHTCRPDCILRRPTNFSTNVRIINALKRKLR